MSDFTPIAEWENHKALFCAWPHKDSGWQERDLDQLKKEILTFYHVVLKNSSLDLFILIDKREQKDLLLSAFDANEKKRVHLIVREFKDVWYRDIGPINVRNSQGVPTLLKPTFNAWGSKYSDLLDAHVGGTVFKECHKIASIFEGGALESNGKLILANKSCFDSARGYKDFQQVIAQFSDLFQTPVLFLDLPTLNGDDTDGHIDTMVRFLDEKTLAIDERVANADNWLEIKTALKDFTIVFLPTPDFGSLPATYANFLFLGSKNLIVPAYGLDTCQYACDVLQKALPLINVIAVPAKYLVRQYGSWHCYALNIYQKEFFL